MTTPKSEIKQNSYTKQFYIIQELITKKYQKLRYSLSEFAAKTEAETALAANLVSFTSWEVY